MVGPTLAWSSNARYVAMFADQHTAARGRILVFDTISAGSPPVAFDAGLRSSIGVRILWWDDALGFYFVGRGEYVGEGVGREALYSVSLDGKTDVRLSGDVGVASIVGVTH